MNDTDLLIKALWVSLQRERRHPNEAESPAFRSQYYTDTLPLDLQAYKARAVEKARSLPDSDYETDGFANPEMCYTDRERVLIWLMAYEGEAERRDIPDPEDWDEDLEWEIEDWDEEKNDFVDCRFFAKMSRSGATWGGCLISCGLSA